MRSSRRNKLEHTMNGGYNRHSICTHHIVLSHYEKKILLGISLGVLRLWTWTPARCPRWVGPLNVECGSTFLIRGNIIGEVLTWESMSLVISLVERFMNELLGRWTPVPLSTKIRYHIYFKWSQQQSAYCARVQYISKECTGTYNESSD